MKSLIVELKELDYLFINRRYADAVEFLGGLLDKYKAPEEIAMILRERAGYYRILKQEISEKHTTSFKFPRFLAFSRPG